MTNHYLFPAAARLTALNLLVPSTPSMVLAPSIAEIFALTNGGPTTIPPGSWRFIPQYCYLYLRALAGGALTTSPTIRIGTNAAHTNIAPAYTPPTSVVVDALGLMPLAAALKAIDLVDPIIFEILSAAVGPSTMTGDVVLTGIAVKLSTGWP